MAKSSMGAIFFFMTLLVLGVFLFFSLSDTVTTNISYQGLYDYCLMRDDCCKESIEHMRQNNLLPKLDDDCPENYFPQSLDCEDSLFWCELNETLVNVTSDT